MMLLTDEGIRLIQHFEGCRLTAYPDVGGVLTIGYGSTGPHVKPGLRITQEEADALLGTDLARFAEGMRAIIPAVADHQFSACVSLAYNIGLRAFRDSTLRKRLMEHDYWGTAGQFGLWIRADGRVLNGLILRRAAERDLFCGFPARWT